MMPDLSLLAICYVVTLIVRLLWQAWRRRRDPVEVYLERWVN